MKKSLLLVPLVLSAIALPARAIDEPEAFYYGKRLGSTVCELVWNGSPSMRSAYMKAFEDKMIYEKSTLISNIENSRGSDNPIVYAYQLGTINELARCLPELEKLPDYIRATE